MSQSPQPGDGDPSAVWPPPIPQYQPAKLSALSSETAVLGKRKHSLVQANWLRILLSALSSLTALFIILAAVRQNNTALRMGYCVHVGVMLVAYAGTLFQVVCFARWTFLAFKNIELIQHRLLKVPPIYSTALVVTPFLNCLASYQLLLQLFQSSITKQDTGAARDGLVIVRSLYVLLLAISVLTIAVNGFLRDMRTWHGIEARFTSIAVAGLVDIALFLVLNDLSRKITSRQQQTARDLAFLERADNEGQFGTIR